MTLPDGNSYARFPAAEKILELDDEQFSKMGLTFKQPVFRAAATAYVAHGDDWARLSPSALVDELQKVRRVGPWTAGAAVADYTNRWDLYPYSDLAVRT